MESYCKLEEELNRMGHGASSMWPRPYGKQHRCRAVWDPTLPSEDNEEIGISSVCEENGVL